MSRASKLASARGETNQARHSTNVAREKLQRVTDERDMLRAEVERLRVDLETERMRLAACGVVAMANTPEPAKKARDMLPQYRSAACDDVARIVDSEMEQRETIAAQSAALEKAKVALGVILDKPRSFETVRVATLALREINALPAAPKGGAE